MKTLLARTYTALSVLIVAFFLTGCVSFSPRRAKALPPDVNRPVVAVSLFENRASFKGGWQLGSGMADLLASEMLYSGNFILVERKHLGFVVEEIKMQRDPRFREEGRVDAGRLKGAHYLVRGVINDFSQMGGGSFFVAVRSFLLGGRGHTARVALTLTIVEVESGQVVDAIQCSGKARAREAYLKGKYEDVSFGGDAFFKTPLGTATRDAIRRGVKEITKKMPRTYWCPVVAELLDDGRVLINGGNDRGVSVGAHYEVRGAGRKITDPVTGNLLSVLPGMVIGRIEVTDVDEQISTARLLQGATIKRGQLLSPVSAVSDAR
jgi:curli biogenesis system outer membrane secretion channel CsgG